MAKYDVVDEAILSELDLRPGAEFYWLNHRIQRVLIANCPSGQKPWRILDRRLQALRKKGMIIFKKGWHKQG